MKQINGTVTDVKVNPLDPLDINSQLMQWAQELIQKRYDMETNEQVRCIAAIARIQYLFMKLREEKPEYSHVNAGTEVRRFAKAFAGHAGKRKSVARSRTAGALPFKTDDDELEY